MLRGGLGLANAKTLGATADGTLVCRVSSQFALQTSTKVRPVMAPAPVTTAV